MKHVLRDSLCCEHIAKRITRCTSINDKQKQELSCIVIFTLPFVTKIQLKWFLH